MDEELVSSQASDEMKNARRNMAMKDIHDYLLTAFFNWKWFVVSLVIALGIAFIYLRYTTPVYQATAQLLIKTDQQNGRSASSNTLSGQLNTSTGTENEMEILKSHSLATETVKDLKLYTSYFHQARVKTIELYKNQEVTVDVDTASLMRIVTPFNLTLSNHGGKLHVTGSGSVTNELGNKTKTVNINADLPYLPCKINKEGVVFSFDENPYNESHIAEDNDLNVVINNPESASWRYSGGLGCYDKSETNIVVLSLNDEIIERAKDYLRQLVVCYNRQANEDKNVVALRTEQFINGRLQKINQELGSTEGAIASYKQNRGILSPESYGGLAQDHVDSYEEKLANMDTQIQLLNSVSSFMNQPANHYQTLPSNVGLQDAAASDLIDKYNTIVLERNRLLRTASEMSPTVEPLTAQLNDLTQSIRRAIKNNRQNLQIQRNALVQQYGKYQGRVYDSPEQEKALAQIGRQQEVKSGLYLMLLQKREENSLSLAATADKGRLIDDPVAAGKVSPNGGQIKLVAFLVGILLPALVIFIIRMLRYKVEGHEDLARLSDLPILADIPVASETAKQRADLVVHENHNSMMEEVFRSLRTNVQFMLKEGQKVILFTSSTSGEGKTFIAANMAMSLALLGKKVLLVGLDIRKPRLGDLFELDDTMHGITSLLALDDPQEADIEKQIIDSNVNDNLKILLSGPVPPNPAELIARPALDITMQRLRGMYDYIVVDTAPVGLVSDTLQLNRISDVNIFVVRADYTPKEAVAAINGTSASGKFSNVALVLNGIDMTLKKYGYYYGYGRYGRYGRYSRYGGYYGKYGRYGTNGSYGAYGSYGNYGNYAKSHYGNKEDNSVKK